MDYDSYDSASELAYSEGSGDTEDYGFDGGADEQPRARQVMACQRHVLCDHSRIVTLKEARVLLQAEYVVLSEDQLRERQQELTETTQAVLGLDAGSAAHVLRFCDW